MRDGAYLVLAALAISSSGACVTVPSGHLAVLVRPGGVAPQPLGEGAHFVGPFAKVQTYDVRAQQRTEDLVALSADGQPIEARASVLTFRPVSSELVALAREVGPDYYRVLIQPTVRSVARQVFASARVDQLDTPEILRAQAEIGREAMSRLRGRHIEVDGVTIRTLGVLRTSAAYAAVVDTAVEEQGALAGPHLIEIERQRSIERTTTARGIASAYGLLAPTLTPAVLGDAANRAWARLLAAAATTVEVHSAETPVLLEVTR
jgi:hypothetical protein